MAKFDKQINDYRSQVLWRIRDCEELLKNRVANQELNDKLKHLENRINATREQETENFHDLIGKAKEETMMRIKLCELFCQDKIRDMKEGLKTLEVKSEKYALKNQIDKLAENEKLMKANF